MLSGHHLILTPTTNTTSSVIDRKYNVLPTLLSLLRFPSTLSKIGRNKTGFKKFPDGPTSKLFSTFRLMNMWMTILNKNKKPPKMPSVSIIPILLFCVVSGFGV
jgi:hypothetical protein